MSTNLPLKQILEAALLTSGTTPLNLERLQDLFRAPDAKQKTGPTAREIRAALNELALEYTGRGIELQEVASGWRTQVRQDYAPWIARLFAKRPARYSRALLETLAIIAYRQPITRGEIEKIRGIAVNSHIIKTLQERNWVRGVGHRETPGRPELLATTRQFLDAFGLRHLDELPSLQALKLPAAQMAASLTTEVQVSPASANTPEIHY